MKFAIGYPLRQPGGGFFACVEPLKHAVAELYFPWPGLASGRSSLGENGGFTDYTAQARLEEDLWAFRDAGIGLDLLLNANCYGEAALSLALERKVCSVLGYMAETGRGVRLGIDIYDKDSFSCFLQKTRYIQAGSGLAGSTLVMRKGDDGNYIHPRRFISVM